jgi:PadR family transcriptional regulator, regulatory protein PadR
MIDKELVAASAGPLVLSILNKGESYGYAIIKRVHELSGGKIQWTDGMLYPVLHRLEEQGLIESKWKESPTGRKRRYYCIRKAGGTVLKVKLEQWLTVYSAITKISEEKPCLI